MDNVARTILVVDDSSTVRQQLRTVLEREGYLVREADNGRTAIDSLRTHGADLVITDVLMPVMGGLDFVRWARASGEYARTPIFVLTTESSGDAAKQGKIAGATAWIVKPFNPDALLRGVQKVLGA